MDEKIIVSIPFDYSNSKQAKGSASVADNYHPLFWLWAHGHESLKIAWKKNQPLSPY